jgi:serine/threonine-protein kinase RsbW
MPGHFAYALTFNARLVYFCTIQVEPGLRPRGKDLDKRRASISGVDTRTEEHTFDSTLESVDAAEAVVVKEARHMGFDEDDEHKIGIAVRECMVNAVVHGNRYNSRKKVHLAVTRSPGVLEISIADEGDHFDIAQLPDPLADENLLRHSGRGILLMQAFMDEFEIRPRQPKGTEVRLLKRLAQTG